MAEQQFFTSLNMPERGLNLSGFREVAAATPSAKQVALQEALQKGEAHVEIFSEAAVLAYGKEVHGLLQKSQTDTLSPEQVLELSKGQADIASLTPLHLTGEKGEQTTVYARPKEAAAPTTEEKTEGAE